MAPLVGRYDGNESETANLLFPSIFVSVAISVFLVSAAALMVWLCGCCDSGGGDGKKGANADTRTGTVVDPASKDEKNEKVQSKKAESQGNTNDNESKKSRQSKSPKSLVTGKEPLMPTLLRQPFLSPPPSLRVPSEVTDSRASCAMKRTLVETKKGKTMLTVPEKTKTMAGASSVTKIAVKADTVATQKAQSEKPKVCGIAKTVRSPPQSTVAKLTKLAPSVKPFPAEPKPIGSVSTKPASEMPVSGRKFTAKVAPLGSYVV